MRKILLTALAAAVAVFGAERLFTARPVQAGGRIAWARSLEEARARARRSNRVLMVDLFTDWCTYCKKLDAETYPDPKVVQASSQFVSARVDAEREGQALARQYEVSGYPTVLFLAPSGKELGRIPGFLPAAEFAAEMKRIGGGYRELPLMEARLKKNPGDLEAVARLATLYCFRGEVQRANGLLSRLEKLDPGDRSGRLALACNDVGDAYRKSGDLESAVSLYRKAAKTRRDPQNIAYAHLAIAGYHLMHNDRNGARLPLEALLKMPNAPGAARQRAARLLAQLKKG